MGKSIPVDVGGMSFSTKKALTEHLRNLIARYAVGDVLEGADLAFCLAVFQFHPESESKLASGVKRLEVRLDQYGHKHFQLHRLDGTDDDISWPWCVRHAK